MAHGSLHQFKAFLERRIARKDKNSGKFEKNKEDYKPSTSKPEYDFPELSQSELEQVKANIRSKMKRAQRNQLLLFLALILLFSVLYFVFA